MKKIILFILLIPFVGFNQDHFTDYNNLINEIKLLKGDDDDDKKKKKVHRFEIGLNGGVNIANLKDIDFSDGTSFNDASKLGNLYGGTIIYNFNRFLCIKGDFDIASKGFQMSDFSFNNSLPNIDIDSTLQNFNGKQFLNYFDVPAFFHLGFGKKIKFDINFGPYLSFLMRNSSKLVNSEGEEMGTTLIEGLDNIDWGFTYGAGLDYYLTDKISIGFDFLIEQGTKLLQGASFGDFKNYSRDFDFGINFKLIEKKSKKLF